MVSEAMKQLEERHLANKVDIIVWSNKMDLLALSNSKGEVCLHRLNWQRAWILAPPAEDIRVQSIAWRPDGKVLAVAYTTGYLYLVNVENKEVFHKINFKDDDRITFISWIEDKNPEVKTDAKYFQESSNLYLPKLPPITRNLGSIPEHECEDDLEDLKLIADQANLNFLLIGVSSGFLSINVFGIVTCGNLYLPDSIIGKGKIVSADLALDLKQIFVLIEMDGFLHLIIYDSSVLSNHGKEIFNVSYKYCVFISLIDYLNAIMVNINEFYENMLLLEMEAKWARYSEENPNSSLSSDFLELLVFGAMSNELDKFLTKDLTEKGIQKLGNSIEISHCSIQKLIQTHLQSVCTNIVFHLSHFRDMARLTERYQILGIEEEAVSKTFREVGAFMLKADEVQLVIDSSLKKYKSFFKWISGVLSRLADDKMSDSSNSIYELSQQETNCIAEYLYSLDNKSEGGKQYWLDKVGQYLLDKDLSETIGESKENFWQKLVQSNSCLVQNEIIIVRDEKLSLVQQMNKLMNVIGDMIKNFRDVTGMRLVKTWEGAVGPSGASRITSLVTSPSTLIIASNYSEQLHLLRVDRSTDSQLPKIFKTQTSFITNMLPMKLIDLQFYLDSTISLLLEESDEGRGALFLQLPVASVRTSGILDITKDLETGGRKIENIVGGKMAVSGARKVVVIVSENRHKVRTYETEVEEDEDEEEMDLISNSHNSSNNTSLDQSIE